MQKIAAFIVRRRRPVMAVMLVIMVLCAVLAPMVPINEDLTAYLPDDSSMKQGMDLMDTEFPAAETENTIRVMVQDLTAEQKQEVRTTLEGLQEEAAEFGAFIADQGAEQCGFCNPGFIMNALALFRENPDPGEDEIKEYLAGNLCRCSGYEGQLRGILNFLAWKKGKEAAQ